MKAHTVIALVALVVASMVLVASCASVQDQQCRKIAKQLGIEESLIERVPKFLLYGPPAQPQTCATKCDAQGMNMGFEYFGKQACCCGIVI